MINEFTHGDLAGIKSFTLKRIVKHSVFGLNVLSKTIATS